MNSHYETLSSSSASAASALIISASDKAGMDGIDRTAIDAIILRESGDSAYMKQQRKRDQAVNIKIEQMKHKLERQQEQDDTSSWRRKQVTMEGQLEREIQEIRMARRTRSTCVVVDMDMFYMACEVLTKPQLTNVPACVSSGNMILTSNYLARRYGVRSAMPTFVANTLVLGLSDGKQRLHHIASNFELYTQKSHQVRSVLAEYDPNLRAYSLDEAYLDLTQYLVLHLDHPDWSHTQIRTALTTAPPTAYNSKMTNSAFTSKNEASGESFIAAAAEEEKDDEANDDDEDNDDDDTDDTLLLLSKYSSCQVLSAASNILQAMRKQVQIETGGLTCSAGLASNFMLAKIASDANKPNGQRVVGPSQEEIDAFVRPLPTRKIPGIGRVTAKMLQAFQITTVQELYEQRALVRFLFTPTTAKFLLAASLGYSSNDRNVASSSESVSVDQQRKGISKERTFQAGKPWSEVVMRLEDIARGLSADMQSKQLRAHTLTVKVKLDTFDVLCRSRTMTKGVCLQEPEQMVSLAVELLMELKRQHHCKGGSVGGFNVRLLGIRCSNFQGDNDNDDEVSDANQTSIDQFLHKQDGKRASSSSPKPKFRAASADVSLDEPVPYDSKKRQFAPLQTDKTTSSTILSPSTNTVAAIPDSTLTPRQQQQEIHCPICNQLIRCESNINRHIDSCLNSSMVRQAIQEESALAAANERSTNKKRRRLSDFFAASK